MRTLFLLFFCLTASLLKLSGQDKIQVLLVGTTHEFQDSLKSRQNFPGHVARLVAFRPDIICIEAIPVWDTASLKQVRSANLAIARELRSKEQYQPRLIPELQNVLKISPGHLIARSQLGNALYAHHDFWNAYYHWYILQEQLQQYPDQASNELKQTFTSDTLHLRTYKRQRNTEFGNLIFPLAHQLGILNLENIDDRADDAEFQKLGKHIARRLLLSLKLFKALKIYKHLTREAMKAEQSGKLLEKINDKTYINPLVTNIDQLGTHWVKSKKAHRAQQLWYARNRRMSDRVKNVIIQKQAKRVIVFVGAAHIAFMARELQHTNQFEVLFYTQ